jgi:hypothetical protein
MNQPRVEVGFWVVRIFDRPCVSKLDEFACDSLRFVELLGGELPGDA